MATSSRKNNESNDYSVEEKIIALYELQKKPVSKPALPTSRPRSTD